MVALLKDCRLFKVQNKKPYLLSALAAFASDGCGEILPLKLSPENIVQQGLRTYAENNQSLCKTWLQRHSSRPEYEAKNRRQMIGGFENSQDHGQASAKVKVDVAQFVHSPSLSVFHKSLDYVVQAIGIITNTKKGDNYA